MNEKEIIDQLLKAKENCRYCLDNGMGLVDMKGLSYWANLVEELRAQLKELM